MFPAHSARTPCCGLLVGAILLASLLGCSAPSADVRRVEEAMLWIGASEAPPGDASDLAWQRVALPDLWPLSRRSLATQGWYRIEIELDTPPKHPWTILLPRVYLNGEVWLNGQALGAGGRMEDPPSRNSTRPLVASAPAGLWRTGTNRVEVRFVTSEGVIGSLHPFFVGPSEDLLGVRTWLEHLETAAQVSVCLALLLALVAWRQARIGRPEDAGYDWFAGSLLGFFFAGFSALFPDAPLPSRLVEWVAGSAMQWSALMFALGVRRADGFPPQASERVWLWIYGLATSVLGLVPALWSFPFWVIWSSASLVMALRTLLRLTIRTVRSSSKGWFFVCIVVVPFGASIAATAFFAMTQTPFFAGPPLVILLPLIGAGGLLVLRGHRSLQAAEEMNRTLEGRVAEKEAELRENYQRIAELERGRVVADERERLTRDLHDGTGGLLVAALALARREESDPDLLERTIADALDDLRLTFGSLQPRKTDLPTLLGLLRPRLQRQAAVAGLEVEWQVSDAGEDRALDSEALLNMARIVQEAVTNAARHSGGSRIWIRSGVSAEEKLFVEVCDDGSTGVLSGSPGLGLENMRHRARQLGGTLEISSDASGTCIRAVFSSSPGRTEPG